MNTLRDLALSKARHAAVRPKLYRGWVMAAVGFASVALVFGTTAAALPFVYGAVVAEFGWSLTEATLLFTVKNVASSGAALLPLGPLLTRFGLRRLMVTAFVATGVGMSAFLIVDSLPTYYLAGAILGFGGAAATIGTNLFVSRWFYRNQGFAVGVALTGTSVGGIVFPHVTVTLIDAIGWRGAIAGLSFFIWAVALPLYLWKAEEEPGSNEIEPELDGQPAEHALLPTCPALSPKVGEGIGAIYGTKTFWTIAFALLFVAAADSAVFQHTPLILGAAGIEAELVAFSLSTMFAFGIVGKIAAGRVFDAWSVSGMALWNVLLAVSIALALLVGEVTALVAFAAVRGLAHGGLIPKPAVLAKHCYGAALMSPVLPVLMGVWLLGAGIGPVVLAALVDATGQYREGIVLLVALALLAAALLHRIHRERARMPASPEAVSSRPPVPTAYPRAPRSPAEGRTS